MHETNWYIIYTKPGEEKKLCDLLTSKGIPNYCPLNKSNQGWIERRHILYHPLFPCYVFVRLSTINLPIVKSLAGVINIVHWGAGYALIPDEEITAMKDFLEEYSSIKVEKTPVKKNDRVRIIYGPLVVMEGDVFEVKNSPVSVIMPSLGCVLVAQERKRVANVAYNSSGGQVASERKIS